MDDHLGDPSAARAGGADPWRGAGTVRVSVTDLFPQSDRGSLCAGNFFRFKTFGGTCDGRISGMEYYDQFGDAGGSGICRSASLYAVCAPGRAENGTDGNADRRGRDDRLYLLGNHGFCCDLRQRCGYCQPA